MFKSKPMESGTEVGAGKSATLIELARSSEMTRGRLGDSLSRKIGSLLCLWQVNLLSFLSWALKNPTLSLGLFRLLLPARALESAAFITYFPLSISASKSMILS